MDQNSRRRYLKRKQKSRRRRRIFSTLTIVLILFGIYKLDLLGFQESTADTLSDQIENGQEQTPYPDENIKDEQEDKQVKEVKDNQLASLDGTTQKDEKGLEVVQNTEDILVLVNKKRTLPSDYVPNDLVIPNVRFPFTEDLPKKKMRKVAAQALEKLFEGAKDEGIHLFAVSGYRSYDRQKTIFNSKVRSIGEEEARRISAFPGQSEHQTGLAMDVSSQSAGFRLTESFGELKEGKWLKDNAYRYGFIIRYPEDKVDQTGYMYEPWHIRYVGEKVSTYIQEHNMILEEYFK